VSFPKSAAVGLFQPTGRRGKLHGGINGEYKRGKRKVRGTGEKRQGLLRGKTPFWSACSLKKLSPQASGHVRKSNSRGIGWAHDGGDPFEEIVTLWPC